MSGGSNRSSSSSTPINVTPQAFRDLQGPFASVLQQMFTKGPAIPSGPYTAPITGREQRLVGDIARADTEAPASATGFLDKFMRSQPYGDARNPFLTSMIKSAQRSTMQGLEETLSRALPGRFTAAGQFAQPRGSSAFDRAAAIATRGAADASADIATNLTGQAFESERNRRVQHEGQQVQAAQVRGELSSAEISNMTQKLQAVALPRLIEQYGIDKGLELFQNQIDSVLAALGVAAGVTRPVVASKGDSKSGGWSAGVK